MRILRLVSLSAVIAMLQLLLAAAGQQRESKVPVPFKSCVSYGQADKSEAPKGTTKYVAVRARDAQKLAYFESADGIRILAPRGWSCEGSSGSSSVTLSLSPTPIHHELSSLQGRAAIVVSHVFSENSGNVEIAQIIGRVFPEYRASAVQTMKGWDISLPSGPFPKDTLKYRSNRIVEFRTPPQTEGLGNFHSWLGKSDRPVAGVAILILDGPKMFGVPPNVVLLSVRLPREMAGLADTIIKYVEEDVGGTTK